MPPECCGPRWIDFEEFALQVADHQQVLADIPDLRSLLRFLLDTPLQCLVEFPQHGFATFALGNLLGNDANADNGPFSVLQWVPVGSPKTLGILFVRSLPIDFNSYNRFSRPQNSLDNIFDLLCDAR